MTSRTHLKALTSLVAIAALTLPASAFLPSAVPTERTVSAQDATLMAYTDPNTGSTARLVTHDGALWCEWTVTSPPAEAWAGVYYFTHCAVKAVGGGTMECGSDSAEGSGAASGSCQVASFLPSSDVQWWISTSATELLVVDSSYVIDSTVQVSRWEQSGSMSASVGLGGAISLAGRFLASLVFDVGLGASSSFSISTERYHAAGSSNYVRERHATVLGLDGGFVHTVPEIESLGINGATFGCDALNIVETALGRPRQLGSYTNSLKARALAGELNTDLGNTRLKSIDNYGAFERRQIRPNGYTLTFDQTGASDGSGSFVRSGAVVDVAVDGAYNEGMTMFSSQAQFTADYETPDVPLLIDMVSVSTGRAFRVQITPLDTGGVLASRLTPGMVDVLVTAPDLAEAQGNLADLLANRLFGAPAGSMVFRDFDCPPSVGVPANRYPQVWDTAATVEGFSGATSGASTLNVDVYLDMNPY